MINITRSVRSLMLLLAMMMLTQVGWGQVTILAWDFTSGNSPSANLPGGSASVSFNTGGTSGTSGCNANGFSISGWNVNEYFQILAPTTGYNLNSLTLSVRSSGTGPGNFKVQYSSNGSGGTFTDLPSSTFASGNGVCVSVGPFDFSSINALDNNANTVFRLVFTGGEADGTPATGDASSAGTFRVDDIVITGTFMSPSISSSGTLSSVNTTYGTASSPPTSFSISGSNMSAGITVTPPAGFEVSTTSDFSSSVGDNSSTLTVGSSGTIASTTVYVRLKASATVAGSPYSGNIVLSSSGATSVNVATASSTVTPKTLTITGLSAADKDYDGTTSVSVTGTPVYSGLVNSESFAVTGTVTWAFPDANVGVNKTLTRTGSYDAPSGNYTVTQPSLTASISAIAPSVPVISFITNGNQQLSVVFTAPSSDGGSVITTYKYSTNGGANWQTRASGTTGSPLVITTLSTDGTTALTNDITYNIQIRAVNTAGEGTATGSTQGTPTAGPLPVSLLSFSGYKNGVRNQLRWVTASELNNSGFEVQRSTDGQNYEPIGFVNSLAIGGNSQTQLKYNFTDANPNGLKQYYRLKQFDIDGRSSLSNILLIQGEKPAAFEIASVYPNPSRGQVTVLLNAPENKAVTIRLIDLAGRTLQTKQINSLAGNNSIPFDISNMAKGQYLISVGEKSVKIVKE
jgi:hypothetical protein